MPNWDVVVVGGGPAGLAAAHAAASAGASTIVVERAEHPRYKTCGGGLIGPSLAVSTPRISVPTSGTIDAITFTRAGRRSFTRRSVDRPLLTMVRRTEFDHAWYTAAVAAGATIRQNCQVRALAQDERTVTVTLADGSEIEAGAVIGADGSAGISSRFLGVSFDQQDLGLEVELAATAADRASWHGRVLLDWGPYPGSYGWVFPKLKGAQLHDADCETVDCTSECDQLTVGVIMEKGRGAETKRYLRDFITQLGLDDRKVLRDSGHLTRCRRPDSPVRNGRVAVVGDAAGLLEPWTREGISFALRSGTWAGEAAAAGDLPSYDHRIATQLHPEMAAGQRMLRVYHRHPTLIHAAMATPLGWRAFEKFCRGELSMADVLARPAIRATANLLGARS